jgi:GDP-L-fucose synthase
MISTDASRTQSPKAPEKLPPDAAIYVAGHRGMVGSAIVRNLQNDGYRNVITRSRAEMDLTVQRAVDDFFKSERVQAVILAAARVGGIYANSTYPAEFIYQNLMIQNNVIHAAYVNGIERLLFLGSSCIYPRLAPQPMREEYLLSGYLEPTNEPYALAKIAGIKMCESYNRQYGTRYRAVMPTNLYGPYDNFDLETSHVLPAMIRKFHLAKLASRGDRKAIERDMKRFGAIPDDILKDLMSAVRARSQGSKVTPPAVRLWGSGRPRREFLHVDDMASACLFIMNLSDDRYQTACISNLDKDASLQADVESPGVSFMNIGSGQDIMIKDLAGIIQSETGCIGAAVWDPSKPDGMPRKLLDVSRLHALGWEPEIDLRQGIQQTYQWYLKATENP